MLGGFPVLPFGVNLCHSVIEQHLAENGNLPIGISCDATLFP